MTKKIFYILITLTGVLLIKNIFFGKRRKYENKFKSKPEPEPEPNDKIKDKVKVKDEVLENLFRENENSIDSWMGLWEEKIKNSKAGNPISPILEEKIKNAKEKMNASQKALNEYVMKKLEE